MAFYVYELVLLTGEVFYVGKGSGDRLSHHRHILSRPHRKDYQRNVYKRMRAFLTGRDFQERIVYMTDDETLALLKEHSLILKYGFENLVNTQSHAFTGRKLKPEVGQIIAERLKAYVKRCREKYGSGHPPRVAAKISAANKGRKQAPGHGQKLWQSRQQNPNFSKDLERLTQHCRQLAESQRGQKQSPEHIAKSAAAHRGQKRTEIQIKNISTGRHLGQRGAPNAKSKYRGVTWCSPSKSWQSRMQLNGKSKCFGFFKLEIDAAWSYDNAFEGLYGKRPNNTEKTHKITRFKRGQHGLLIPKLFTLQVLTRKYISFTFFT